AEAHAHGSCRWKCSTRPSEDSSSSTGSSVVNNGYLAEADRIGKDAGGGTTAGDRDNIYSPTVATVADVLESGLVAADHRALVHRKAHRKIRDAAALRP